MKKLHYVIFLCLFLLSVGFVQIQSTSTGGGGSGLTNLNGLITDPQTFGNDTNVTIVSSGSTHTITWAGILGVTRGGTANTTPGADQLLVGDGATYNLKTLPSCSNATTSKLLYDSTTDTFSCGTDTDTGLTAAITSLGGQTGATQTFANDTNVTISSSGNTHTLGWTGTLATSRASTALKSASKSVSISSPTTSASNLIQWEFPSAVTASEIVCSTDTGTVTIQFDERARATPNTAGTNVLTSSLVCDSNSEASTTFSNAGIAADVPLNLQITATASSPTIVRIHFQYTID